MHFNLETELKEVKENGTFKVKKSEVQKIIKKEIEIMGEKITQIEKENNILKKQVQEVYHLKKVNESMMEDNSKLKNEIEKTNEKLAIKEMEFQISKKRIDEFNE